MRTDIASIVFISYGGGFMRASLLLGGCQVLRCGQEYGWGPMGLALAAWAGFLFLGFLLQMLGQLLAACWAGFDIIAVGVAFLGLPREEMGGPLKVGWQRSPLRGFVQ